MKIHVFNICIMPLYKNTKGLVWLYSEYPLHIMPFIHEYIQIIAQHLALYYLGMKWAGPNIFDVIYKPTVAMSVFKRSSGRHLMINYIHFWGLINVSMMPCAEVVFNNMSQQMAGKGKHRGCTRSFKHGHQFTNSVNLQSLQSVCVHTWQREREREECASCVLNVEDSLRSAL